MPISNVLIVDDSKTELMFLTDLLQKNGMTVRTAQGADEAFKRLAEEKPDLILMDVVMPGQNGYQLTRSISRSPEYTGIPIILCTSKSLETDRVWGHAPGSARLHHQTGRPGRVARQDQGTGLIGPQSHGQSRSYQGTPGATREPPEGSPG